MFERTSCPECDVDIDVDGFDVDRGDTVSCLNLDALLEVRSLSPIEFELASDNEDDEVVKPAGCPGALKTMGKSNSSVE